MKEKWSIIERFYQTRHEKDENTIHDLPISDGCVASWDNSGIKSRRVYLICMGECMAGLKIIDFLEVMNYFRGNNHPM